jgi:hypothetical protein
MKNPKKVMDKIVSQADESSMDTSINRHQESHNKGEGEPMPAWHMCCVYQPPVLIQSSLLQPAASTSTSCLLMLVTKNPRTHVSYKTIEEYNTTATTSTAMFVFGLSPRNLCVGRFSWKEWVL